MRPEERRDRGGLVAALVLVGVGILTLVDANGYSDADSRVFPQTAAIVLILAAGASAAVSLLRGTSRDVAQPGSTWRRVLLVLGMLLGAFAMPWIGFLPAALVVFLLTMLAAMHDGWSARRAFVYTGVAIAVVVGFTWLFEGALNVPLPDGWLF